MAEVGAGRGKHCGTSSPLLAAINSKNQYGSRCYVYELTQIKKKAIHLFVHM